LLPGDKGVANTSQLSANTHVLHLQGFKLLYLYQKAHPEFSLEQYLSGRSPQFQVSLCCHLYSPGLNKFRALSGALILHVTAQEHVHKNLAKVHAQAEASQSMSESSSSVSMPLQVSSRS
jgi:hypothetical protein